MNHLQTFESACSYLGKEPILPIVNNIDEKHSKAIVAAYKLFTISEASWKQMNMEIDWNNFEQTKYYPWFDLEDSSGSAPGFSFFVYVCGFSVSTVGSRLVFPSREIAEYVGKTHEELYKDFMVL